MTDDERMAQHRRSLAPSGGTCTDEDLRALTWLWRRGPSGGETRRTRELLAESPGRDLASAAIQARDEMRVERDARRVA